VGIGQWSQGRFRFTRCRIGKWTDQIHWRQNDGRQATLTALIGSIDIDESAIRMADNPVEHSRTKHIDIRHHFLRDHQQKGDIEVFHVSSENQLADIFTKPLDEQTFCKLSSELNVIDSRNLD
jgi:hypothetical protein